MIRVKVRTRQVDRDRYALATLEAAGRAAEREARQMAIDIRLELRRRLNAEFERRPVNRRKRGTTRLHNSFRVLVERGSKPGGFPYNVVLTTNANLTDDERAKVLSLMNGSRPHEILPRNADKLSWTKPSGGRIVVAKVGPPVTKMHPGTRGTDTLRKSRDAVVARRRRGV